MARLAGVDIPRDKRVEVALTYIYGVGRTRALTTLKETGISGDIRVKDLSDDQLIALRDFIEGTYKVEGDLRVRCRPTSAARSRSAHTRASGTAAACPARTAHPFNACTRKARSAPSPARRRQARSNGRTEAAAAGRRVARRRRTSPRARPTSSRRSTT